MADPYPVTRSDMTADNDERDGAPPKKTPQQVADYWLGAIQSAEKRRKPFITRGRQILKRFKNKRTLTTLGVPIANRRMNVLWSNVQTQKPVLFAQMPKANVSRRNKTKDPIGRVASIVLQNTLQNSIAMEDFAYVMQQIVEDRLLPGAGLAMVEYVPQVEDNQVGWQAAETRYIHWEDWLTNPARVWQENWFFAYRVYLTRKEAYDVALAASQDEKFAEDVWREITLDHREDGSKDEGKRPGADDGPAKAIVWVVWDMTGKQVIQISPGYPKAPLATMPPPVSFDSFWPCPRPLQSTTSNDSTIPVPDFEQYVDQADEIDLMTQRIGTLAKALRLRGLYPADMDSLKQLTEAGDADMIPYDQWQLIQERGGADSLVIWFPVEAIAKTLVHCIEVRQQAIEVMYEVTGISDIMRGQTEPSETATAQQLKSQFGGVRIRESQKDVQRFIRDILRLKAEVICEHFTIDTIKAMSGMRLLSDQEKHMVGQAAQMWTQYKEGVQQLQEQAKQTGQPAPVPPPPGVPQPSEEMMEALDEPSWDQVMAVLQNEKLRGFVVDVETDSTIEPDQQAQQASAATFVQAVAEFMTAALPIMQVEPESVDFLGELMSWTTRQWKSADTIEGAVDEFVEKMKKKIEQQKSQPPPVDPKLQVEQVKAQAEGQKAQAQIADTQAKAAANQQSLQLQAQVDQMKAQMDAQAQQMDFAIKQMEARMEAERVAREADLAERQHERDLERMAEERKAGNGADA